MSFSPIKRANPSSWFRALSTDCSSIGRFTKSRPCRRDHRDHPLQQKLKSLKGLTVGVTNPAALTAHLAHFVIRKAGYTPQQDVQIIPVGAGPTWLAALENRKVDVALTAPPVPETAINRGFAMMFIENTKGEDPSISEFLMENLIARPETLKKDPDLVRRMVRALYKANQWALSSTPEQVAEALRPTFAKTDPAIHLAGVKAVHCRR